MKITFPFLVLLALFIGIGCQQPCTKTTKQTTYAGDTIYTIREYPNCEDTLSYNQKQVKADSSIVSEGRIVNGKKEGEWIYNGYVKRVLTFNSGIEVAGKEYGKTGNLQMERVLEKDSLYFEKNYFKNGNIESESFVNTADYLIGRGVEYDTLGRKMAEGEHIAEPVLPDTAYIENPNPPYDLQPTIITENGGKHGPWLYYDGAGNHIATVNYDRGVAIWTGNLAGKWKLDSVSTEGGSSIKEGDLEIRMAMSDLSGYEFSPGGTVNGVGEGIYYQGADHVVFYCTNNGENQRVWLRGLTPAHLTLQTVDMTLYFVRAGNG